MAGEQKFLRVFFEEKGIDCEERFTVEGPEWGENSMPYGVVIEAIRQAPKAEQVAIVRNLRLIDFKNGDVRAYLRHLGKALAL